MGLLDILTGNDPAASPWGALFQNPADAEAKKQAAAANLLASMGVGPTNLAQPSQFGDPSKLSAVPAPPMPAPSPFTSGASAAPFGFASPTLASVNPSQIAPPPAAPIAAAPAPAAPPAPPPTSLPQTVANANASDDQNDPLAVGNYQMPRIGAGFPDDGEDAPTAAAARPSGGPMVPPGASAGPAAAPFSLGGRVGAGFRGMMANAPAGPLGAIFGGIAGLAGMGQPTAEQRQSAAITANAQALQKAGAKPEAIQAAVAMAAAGDTKPLGALFSQYYGADKFQHVTRKDQFGGEEIGSFDPTTGKTTFGGATGDGATAPAAGVQGMIDNIAQKRAAGAPRADLIKEIPPQYQGYVASLLDGKAVPANIGRGQARGTLMTLAHAIDPNFDETTIPARITTAKDFTPQGKSGASIVAFNTVQHHIGKLSDDLENIGDTGWTVLNAIRNGIATNTPLNQKQGKAVQAINDDIKAVTDEMSGAYKAGHISDTEIKSWNSLINSNAPLPQMRQAISDFVDLLNGKRDALNKVHQQIMGGDAAIIDKQENAMITKKAHDRNAGIVSAPGATPGAITEGATATNTQTGQKITFRNGQWQ